MLYAHGRVRGSGAGGDAGATLPITPDGRLDVRDLSLSDGDPVTEWGFISSWGLTTPTYNASENAVDFASAASADILSITDFASLGGFTCSFLVRDCGGDLIFVSTNASDTFGRLLMMSDDRGFGTRGGRQSDAESFKSANTPSSFLRPDVPWFVATIVADWENGEILGYNNGSLASRASTASSGPTDATPAKTAALFGADRVDASNLAFSGLVKNVNLYATALTPAQIRQDAGFLLSVADSA